MFAFNSCERSLESLINSCEIQTRSRASRSSTDRKDIGGRYDTFYFSPCKARYDKDKSVFRVIYIDIKVI